MELQKLYAVHASGIYGEQDIAFFRPSNALLEELAELPAGSLVGLETVKSASIFHEHSPYIAEFYPEFASDPYWRKITKSCAHLRFTHLGDLLYWQTLLDEAGKFYGLPDGNKRDALEKELLFRVSIEYYETIRNNILEKKPCVALVNHAVAQYLIINPRELQCRAFAHDQAQHFVGKEPEEIEATLTKKCSRIPNVLVQSIEIDLAFATALDKRLKELKGGN